VHDSMSLINCTQIMISLNIIDVGLKTLRLKFKKNVKNVKKRDQNKKNVSKR